jgi:hypothetical protein
MREMIRKHARFFLGVTLVGLAFRLFLVFRAPGVVDDSRLYADIAKNWLQHGIYGITNSGAIMPTLSRLPGYPAFLAAIFWIFGSDNFRAVLLLQVLFDLATCFLIADTARRLFSERAAKAAFLLAAVCPFLANYAGAALTETLEIFFTALAFDLAFRGLNIGGASARPRLAWLGCGLAIGGAILLRPDGGILLASIAGCLLWLLLKTALSKAAAQSEKDPKGAPPLSRFVRQSGDFDLPANPVGVPTERTLSPTALILAGTLVATGALAPLIPWTMRNLHTLHRFQPLAPRYANDSDESVMPGFNRWVKTWMADYVSVQEIYWPVSGSDIDFSRLPRRAFDSSQQRNQTADLFSAYNASHDMAPEIDARFAALAEERIHAAPLRYYVWLPALRIADMWLRPRTELFPSDPRWWEFNDDYRWLALSLAFGVINLAYVLIGLAGFARVRATFGIGMLLVFVVLRSLFLGSLENPEPRYTLECFPAVMVAVSALFHRR